VILILFISKSIGGLPLKCVFIRLIGTAHSGAGFDGSELFLQMYCLSEAGGYWAVISLLIDPAGFRLY
jgi:hypothetical protein